MNDHPYLPTAIVALAFLTAIGMFIRQVWKDRKEDERTRRLQFKTHLSLLKEEIEGLYSQKDIENIPNLHDQILDFSNSFKDIPESMEKGEELQKMLTKKEKELIEKHQREVAV